MSHWYKPRPEGAWKVQVKVNYVYYFLGYAHTKEEADERRREFRRRLKTNGS